MYKRRSDAWTRHEELLLISTTLEYIRQGRTQLQAFEDVGEKIGRTPAAVGFRFNATLRREYRIEIKQARKERIMTTFYGKRLNKIQPNFDEKILQLIGLSQEVMKENEQLKKRIKDYQHIETLINRLGDKKPI